MLHGTGDVFASTLLAAVMAGSNLAEATAFAADFTADAMLISAKQPNFEDRGVSFEPLLGKVTACWGKGSCFRAARTGKSVGRVAEQHIYRKGSLFCE